jgi:hypothetical protein
VATLERNLHRLQSFLSQREQGDEGGLHQEGHAGTWRVYKKEGTADSCINLNVHGGITGVHLRGCCREQSSTLGFCFLH